MKKSIRYIFLTLVLISTYSCSKDFDTKGPNDSLETRDIGGNTCEKYINFTTTETTEYLPLDGDTTAICIEDIALFQTATIKRRMSLCTWQEQYCLEVQRLSSSKDSEDYNLPFHPTTVTICDGVVSTTDTTVPDFNFNDIFVKEMINSLSNDTIQAQALMDSLILDAQQNGTLLSSQNSDLVGFVNTFLDNQDVMTVFMDKALRRKLGYTITDANGKVISKVQFTYNCAINPHRITGIILSSCLLSPVCRTPMIKRNHVSLDDFTSNII